MTPVKPLIQAKFVSINVRYFCNGILDTSYFLLFSEKQCIKGLQWIYLHFLSGFIFRQIKEMLCHWHLATEESMASPSKLGSLS